MPLKSWAWKHRDHPIRAEIWWRYTGWSRQRLYIDHSLVRERRGYLLLRRSLSGPIPSDFGADDAVEVRFGRALPAGSMKCRVRVNGQTWQWDAGQLQLERTRFHSESADRIGPSGFGIESIPVGMLLFLVFIVYIVIVCPFLLILGGIQKEIHERRRKRRLQQLGRFLEWEEVEKRMGQGPGTLIFYRGTRPRWWTDEDVLARCPFPPPVGRTVWKRPDTENRPFIIWCHYHYLAEDTGKAFATEGPPSAKLKLFLHPRGRSPWKRKYPELRVVDIAYAPEACLKSVERYMGMLDNDLKGAQPGLIAAIQDTDPAIRSMALQALRSLAAARPEAIPVLTERLYSGPWSERHDVAAALAAVGGEAVLQEASNVEDPWIKWPAYFALMGIKSRNRSKTGQNP
jgi:hypothetical protein